MNVIFSQEDFEEGRAEGLACLKIIAHAMEIECEDVSTSEMEELTLRIMQKYRKIGQDEGDGARI